MTAFELALVALNLLIAAIYTAILWVMVQQRRLMDKQLEIMQAQLREAERTRMSAYRPILRVEPPLASGLPYLDFYQVRNIGVGAALNVLFFVHEIETEAISVTGEIEPIGAEEFSKEFPVTTRTLLLPALTIVYADVFGNRFWTLYDTISQTQTFGEGKPPHLKGVN
ncbi:MAG: hypothetical protein N3B10_04240 [Armatimonadetes bacterium]|nr:hypothetical protein [Armatimonadota bacterium]MCX7967686.1 hypothetical protein [Armatimonadota bacterium]MDW8142679.1 hypothetical protein [Armatimonadota bacterium]